ncbi:hypothetical protein [Mucilaginibacter flavidus]|uniref:hypothetical protein n=1 Tax=Mucilaginibacter flavidus TaxID=2949309 RepID=UPI0020924E9E|nr:hypothetical protein [Mucilaginibacter flavidus]MCO5948448.1 hypothetical protein [Mucilaginibacter flavidus]
MDNLIDYADFKKDIENGFSELISEFDLELVCVRGGLYILRGANCILKFTFDRGDVFCEFKEPSDNIHTLGYGVFQVLKFLHSDVKTNGSYINPTSQLLKYAKVICEYLKNVLNGDFSWLSAFLKSQSEYKKTINYIFDELNYYHPIARKMRSGDISWEQDFQNYLKENNIEL